MLIQDTRQLFRLVHVRFQNNGYLQMNWAAIFYICLLNVLLIFPVRAQSLPNYIRIIIPFAPSGPTDVMGRLAAESLAQHTKSTVINENRPALAEQAVQSGKVKLLALVGKRSSSFPDLPTITEQGFPGLETLPWFVAIMGSRGMRS